MNLMTWTRGSFLMGMTALLFSQCGPADSTQEGDDGNGLPTDSVMISFAFVGCNRVGYTTYKDGEGSNASSANLPALKRTFNALSGLSVEPDLLFFLGDLVVAETTDTTELNSQLEAWFAQYQDPAFSDIPNSDIELVAVPGNHEMLFYDDTDDQEYPLAAATDIWMRHALPYLPKDRITIAEDSLNNRASFAFSRGTVGFVVMNTDTYNAPAPGATEGLEGQAPTEWVSQQLAAYAADPGIEHIFVLGHRPYYVEKEIDTAHAGFPDGAPVWQAMEDNGAVAMLSAHQHNYEREQPGADGGPHQIIAGNGGSPVGGDPTVVNTTHFGYSIIEVWASGKVKLFSLGWEINPVEYYLPSLQKSTALIDSVTLTWEKTDYPFSPTVIDSAYSYR